MTVYWCVFFCVIFYIHGKSWTFGSQMSLSTLYLRWGISFIWNHHVEKIVWLQLQRYRHLHLPDHYCWDFRHVPSHLALYLDSGQSQLCFSSSGGKPFSKWAICPVLEDSIPVNKSSTKSAMEFLQHLTQIQNSLTSTCCFMYLRFPTVKSFSSMLYEPGLISSHF